MSDKTKRALARIALVFMAVFTVFFIVFLTKPDLWNGAAAFIALFSGIPGIGLFLFIKFFERSKSENMPVPDEDDTEGGGPENTEKSDDKTEDGAESANEPDTENTP